MDRKRTGKSMFHRYFSGFYVWNAVIAVLFIISFAFVSVRGDLWGRYGIPACFLFLLLFSIRYYILFFTALRDLKGGRIETLSIRVQELVQDKAFTYFNVGGIAGDEKCLLIDPAGSQYRVTLHGAHVGARPSAYYSGAQVDVVCLSGSRIVLKLKTTSSDDPAKHLREDFSEYFA